MMLRESTLPKAYLATISAPSTQGEKAVEYQKMPAPAFRRDNTMLRTFSTY
jgi:hypothetical protein